HAPAPRSPLVWGPGAPFPLAYFPTSVRLHSRYGRGGSAGHHAEVRGWGMGGMPDLARTLRLALAGLMVASPAAPWAAASHVQGTCIGPTSKTTFTVTLTATGAGNLLVVGMDLNTAVTVSSITDTAGDTFQQVFSVGSGSGNDSEQVFYAFPI